MAKSRNSYTDSFREQVARLVTDEGHSQRQVSIESGVSVGTVNSWVRKLRSTVSLRSAESLLAAQSLTEEERAELRALRRENGRLRKKNGLLRQFEPDVKLKVRVIRENWSKYSVGEMCGLLDVRRGLVYYKARPRALCAESEKKLVEDAFARGGGYFGARKVVQEIRRLSPETVMSARRAGRIMASLGLKSKYVADRRIESGSKRP